jgi:lipopolysaccharide transport system permease protein
MIKEILTLIQYKDLLWMWSRREISIRYKQSFLGIAWAILQPLSLMLVFSIVFTRLVKIQTGDIPYPVFSYVALLPWTFFATSISFASTSLVGNMNLVTKIYFPREILPIATNVASFIDFLIASFVFIGMLFFYQISIHLTILWVLVALIVQILLTLGVSFLVASLNVLYRDIRFIVPLGMQIWMYASPVIYPVSSVPQSLHWLYGLNPMVGIIDTYRQVILVGEPPNIFFLLLSTAVSIVLFLGGYFIFKRLEPIFADVI